MTSLLVTDRNHILSEFRKKGTFPSNYKPLWLYNGICLLTCVSRYVHSRRRPWTPPQASTTTGQLWQTTSSGKPWISSSIAWPPRSLLLRLSSTTGTRSRKPGPKRGDRMPDVPGLLHPGHPESSDDRPEQPGDGQEHPARVCLHPLCSTHRHIVTPGTSNLSVLSVSTLCHYHGQHLPSTFPQVHKYLPNSFTLRSNAAFRSY